MPQFFINKQNIDADYIYITDRTDIKHITSVLRFKNGNNLLIADEEYVYDVKIIDISKTSVKCQILSKEISKRKLNFSLTLAQSMIKSTKQDMLIQKATELGVEKIIPLITDNTVVRLKTEKDKEQKNQRWTKIAYESCKQCERINFPEIAPIIQLKDLFKTEAYDVIFACVERNAAISIKEYLQTHKSDFLQTKKVLVIIGPEGGWSNEELLFFEDNKVGMVSLGNLILRAETAVITALSDVIYEYEYEHEH